MSSGAPAGERMIAFNANLDKRALRNLHPETVMLFECAPGAPAAGGPEDMDGYPRSTQGYIIVLVNGESHFVPREMIVSLSWGPE